MELSERKKKILKAVIGKNIQTAEPISSKELQEEHLKDISSATIRNELMALEEMGYLFQPHTSSGRVPTAEGFKFFIDELMPNISFTKKDFETIKQNFSEKLIEIEDIVKTTAKAISNATNLPSVVFSGITNEAVIESIKIVKITESTALVVVVTDSGIIKDIAMDTSGMAEEAYNDASKLLTQIFAGKKLGSVEKSEILIKKEFSKFKTIFSMLVQVIEAREKESTVAVEGISNLFKHQEFQDAKKVQSAVALMEDHQKLVKLFDGGGLELQVKVGGNEKLKDCSVVSATYKLLSGQTCTVGVIGPVRMDYPKIVSVLKGLTKVLKEFE